MIWISVLGSSLILQNAFAAEARTLVTINGVQSEVHFNDGDSFKIKQGPFTNTQSRLAGFNTLESFGTFHRFGSWHPRELYFLAKAATKLAQKGSWHCTTDTKRDGYGRMLFECDDLAIAQIENGLAHAMTIDMTPAKPEYLAAQKRAMDAKKGFWAKQIPAYILTSLHSVGETEKNTYNRLLSTEDGHSVKVLHHNMYPECKEVCYTERTVTQAEEEEWFKKVPKDVRNSSEIGTDKELKRFIKDFLVLKSHTQDEFSFQDFPEPLWKFLIEQNAKQPKKAITITSGSCARYVEFNRRYRGSPRCLHE